MIGFKLISNIPMKSQKLEFWSLEYPIRLVIGNKCTSRPFSETENVKTSLKSNIFCLNY